MLQKKIKPGDGKKSRGGRLVFHNCHFPDLFTTVRDEGMGRQSGKRASRISTLNLNEMFRFEIET